MLNARSSADMSYAGGGRRLALLQGQALVSPAPSAASFLVSTPHCTASAAGGGTGRFLVARGARHSLVAALEQDLLVSPASGASWLLSKGRGCRLGGPHVQMLDTAEIHARAAWRHGRLEVLDEPLSQVVGALQDYRRGIIHVQAQAASIRVQAVLPLDDTDRALDMLAQVLPLTITRYGDLYADIALRT
jgi:transmembrane sensor